MGTLPQVIDTIIFIQGGQVAQVLTIKQLVKTPAGMESDDLARPVIHVTEWSSEEVLYEIYTYGDNVVVMPLDELPSPDTTPAGIHKYAQIQLQQLLREILNCPVTVKINGTHSITIYIPEREKGRVIGKAGTNIDKLQDQL